MNAFVAGHVSESLRRVVSGSGVVVARAGITVLIGSSDIGRGQDVWSAVGAESSVEDVIDILTQDGVRSMPDAVIVGVEGDQLRVIVRGSVLVDVSVRGRSDSPDDVQHHLLDGSTILSWTEVTIVDWVGCRMYLGEATGSISTDRGTSRSESDVIDSGPVTYLSSGVAHASTVILSHALESVPGSAGAFFADRSAKTAADHLEPKSQAGRSVGDAPAPPSSEVSTVQVSYSSPGSPTPDDRTALAADLDETGAETDPVGDDPYSAMFGQTTHRDVQAAAVVVTDHQDLVDSSASHPAASAPDGVEHVGVEQQGVPTAHGNHADANSTRSLADYKDGNGASSTASDRAPTAAPMADGANTAHDPTFAGDAPEGQFRGDHDGHTIAVTELRRRVAEAAGSFAHLLAQDSPVKTPTAPGQNPVVTGPTVQAVLCGNGHPNPVYVGTCRQCGHPVSGSAVVIGRPTLGRLRSSTGDVVELDRPVIVGRNPSLIGRRLSEIPHEWRIAAGDGLSRNHAMFHIDGWQVRVEDLGSVNATTVTLPGREPEMLRAGEPVLITDGTLIDLGGEVTCTYDATA